MTLQQIQERAELHSSCLSSNFSVKELERERKAIDKGQVRHFASLNMLVWIN